MDSNSLSDDNAALDDMRQNMDMKQLAKEILLEENYERFMKSYKFTFWFQLLGTMGGLLVPSMIMVLIFHEVAYAAFGAAIGIVWIIIWLILSQFLPQTRICRKFSKWYRKADASIRDLDEIFYQK